MKKKLKKFSALFQKTIAITIVFCLSGIVAISQTVVTGKVTEAKSGAPLSGITVAVKGSKVSSQTNAEGVFKLTAPAGSATLVFSSVGYLSQEAPISSGNVAVSLSESAQQLNDVVVVAYGTRKKTDLTGAVTAVSSKDFQREISTQVSSFCRAK